MLESREEYNNICKEIEDVSKEIKELKENKCVAKYIDLSIKNNNLIARQYDLYKKLRNDEFKNCRHALIVTELGDNIFDCFHFGCIKCGLYEDVLNKNFSMLTSDERIMYDFFNEWNIKKIKGRIIDEKCNIELARAIYMKIKEKYPKISDEKASKYLRAALFNMRYKDTSEDRKKSRIKRLSLNYNFNNWF